MHSNDQKLNTMIRLIIKGMNTLNSFIQFGVGFQIFFKLPDQANPFQFSFCQVPVFSINIESEIFHF